MSKHVVIAGGGIAGMAAATFLVEAGFRVTICESASALGGKAKSRRTPEGNPIEHSLRVYSPEYQTLLSLLSRIPAGDGRFLLDNLVVVYGAQVFKRAVAGKYRQPQPLPRPHAGTGIRPKNPRRLAHMLRSALTFSLGFSRQGVPLRECLFYVGAHMRLLFRSPDRIQNDLADISYGEYLRMPRRSAEFQRYFTSLPQIITAAREDADALSIVKMMNNVLFYTRTRAIGMDHLPLDTVMMMNGPTSERMLEPWTRYLEARGVEIRTGAAVSDFAFSDGAIRTVILADGRRLDCDCAILSLPYLALRRLSERTCLGKHVPHLNQAHRMRLESSAGIQFFLKALPEPLPVQFRPGVPASHLESPWAFVSVVQGQGFWNGVSLPEGTRYVLSATWSTFDRPGLLTHKTAVECSPEEICGEALTQCKFDKRLVTGWRIGAELRHLPESEYKRSKEELPPHLAYEPVNGVRLINFAPLLIHLPGASHASPRIQTEVANLFLAGEATWSPDLTFLIPTMEKAANSGFHAARQAAAHADPAAPEMTLPPFEKLPFEFVRRFDHWFWKTRGN